VRQETINIEALYQKKMKQAQVQRKIAQSNHQNKCRLKVLQAREEMLDKLFVEAKERLKKVSTDSQRYEKFVEGLLLQSMTLLMESEVSVMCRAVDVKLIEKHLSDSGEVIKKFEERTNNTKKVSVKIADKKLPDSCAGGIVLSGHEGKIICNNTLEARLDLAAETLLPAIRQMLFGIPANRRFFD
jgi:V-type H+-transporting ATPase subunit E